ncbi:hypothetical protein ASL83_003202 [Vibrio parahaemolyticus]|uniref:Uncharacterized protein n=2 Tax=Vibrio harveyi group TaxID=717610 RepID=A0A9Q3YKF2_VIBPH|nr:hypothetical protein [Vibrio parahaemolyticus]EJE4724434.1 hypothetical protein [Vibrio parahaemolyticus]MCC3803985.1 hypothetical protein [Vibrio parahaemolyticus]CAH1598324.1 hypothetical protein THF1C08_50075 [Vibrio jasicida]CAH1601859.1 hypothetical protein THF1A12_50273 [Vibrio jasicida]
MKLQVTVNETVLKLNANANIVIPFLEEGNIGAAIAAVQKLRELAGELETQSELLVKEAGSKLTSLELRNLSLSSDLSEANIKAEDTATSLKQANQEKLALQQTISQLENRLQEKEGELGELQKKFELEHKELLALRQKNPGLLEKELSETKAKLERSETKKKEEIDKRKLADSAKHTAEKELKERNSKSIIYIPLSKWVKGKNNENQYRIVETDQITRIARGEDDSRYSDFIDTDFQLLVEMSSGVSYKVHVSDWLYPVKPSINGFDHNDDYPVQIDKLLKEEFEKRIKATYPQLVESINKAKNLKIEQIEQLTDGQITLLKNANIETLYQCVIFPPELFLSFLRKHNVAVDISDVEGKDLYDTLHYIGCSLKADYLLNEDDKKPIAEKVKAAAL